MDKEKELVKMETKKKEEEIDAADFMKVKFSKAYKFDGGREVEELDLNGLENLTAGDMIQIGKEMRQRGNTDASPEFTMEFALYAAMHVTEFPLEFFLGLSAKDAMKVKLRVNYFFAR